MPIFLKATRPAKSIGENLLARRFGRWLYTSPGRAISSHSQECASGKIQKYFGLFREADICVVKLIAKDEGIF